MAEPTITRRARNRQRAASTQATQARIAAYEVGRTVRVRQGFARELLDSHLSRVNLAAAEAAFARVLVFGVVSCQGSLDQLIDGVLASPKDVDDDIRDCLRISAYELFYLEKPAHAVVDQGVALVRYVKKKAAGVANFVLRRLAEQVARFPFGDPVRDLQARALKYGFPLWLTEMLDDELGSAQAMAFMDASNRPAPVFFAVNRCLCQADQVTRALQGAGIAFVPCGLPDVFVLEKNADVSTPAFMDLIHAGQVIISDLSAQTIAQWALPQACPASMLEVGAGRGTKTLLLQSAAQAIYGGQVDLTSVDLYDFKADLLKERLARYGVTCGSQVVADATDLDGAFPGKLFDVIFIDAPCSGVGTLRRHPEIRWRLQPTGVEELAATGAKMLASAAKHVAVGGTILYSTCTITPRETRLLMEGFFASEEGQAFEQVPLGASAEGDRARNAADSAFAPKLTAWGGDAHFAFKVRRMY